MVYTGYNLKDRVGAYVVDMERVLYGSPFTMASFEGFNGALAFSTKTFNASTLTDHGVGDYSYTFTNAKLLQPRESGYAATLFVGTEGIVVNNARCDATQVGVACFDNTMTTLADRGVNFDLLGEEA